MPTQKPNDYYIIDNYIIMYTHQGYKFYIDLEDLDKVKNICWCKDNDGYILGWDSVSKKMIKLSRLIMNCPDDMFVDHIGGNNTINDNRKKNLRICSNTQNQWNRKEAINNTSGHKDVFWVKSKQKWNVRMCINGIRKSYGYYANYNDACAIQEQIENQNCGEFAYHNSQTISKAQN